MASITEALRDTIIKESIPIIKESISNRLFDIFSRPTELELISSLVTVPILFDEALSLIKSLFVKKELENFDELIKSKYDECVKEVLDQILSNSCSMLLCIKDEKNMVKIRMYSLLLASLDGVYSELWHVASKKPLLGSFNLSGHQNSFKELILEIVSIIRDEASIKVEKTMQDFLNIKKKLPGPGNTHFLLSEWFIDAIKAHLLKIFQLIQDAKVDQAWKEYIFKGIESTIQPHLIQFGEVQSQALSDYLAKREFELKE